MKEQLITFETAKLAKEKGFDIEVYFTWVIHHAGETLWNHFEECQFGKIEKKEDHNVYMYRCSAPTQSLLQKWLRERHNIEITIEVFIDNNSKKVYDYCIYSELCEEEETTGTFDNYEEALEESLEEALKLIK